MRPVIRIPELDERVSAAPPPRHALAALVAALRARRRVVVLTGAGCSTESGIPDYRGPGTRARKRNPIKHHEFLASADVRRRYWARSALGWQRVADARPNPAHHALARLEHAGVVPGIITQNVDRLHQAAGSRRVIELHGALAEVRCTDCGAFESRAALQARIEALNPDFHAWPERFAPDGDADVDSERIHGFTLPHCLACGDGTLMPNVVFFGGNVAPEVVTAAFDLFDAADALLVVGSSLAVWSGFRFARRAAERGLPLLLVNLGPSRADDLAGVRVEAQAGETLTALADALGC